MIHTIGSVHSLWRYPVRSMRGEELRSASITSRGVLGDRCYCVVDIEENIAAEASYAPLRWGGLVKLEAVLTEPPTPGSLPPPVCIRLPDGSERFSSAPDIADWLTEHLGKPASLWRGANADGASIAGGDAEASGRALEMTDRHDVVGAPKRGYDRAPIHLVTTSSLRQAESLRPESCFDPARFRPNIVLDTGSAEGFIESGWIGRTLALGPELRLQLVEPCERCALTTAPQGDLERDPLILSTITRKNGGNMGVYARVVVEGSVSRGDTIELI